MQVDLSYKKDENAPLRFLRFVESSPYAGCHAVPINAYVPRNRQAKRKKRMINKWPYQVHLYIDWMVLAGRNERVMQPKRCSQKGDIAQQKTLDSITRKRLHKIARKSHTYKKITK